MLSKLKHYIEIIKPGIIAGNTVLIIGSFILASRDVVFDVFLFIYTILGTSLVIASACVFNNVIDCDIDFKMHRTNERVLSNKLLSPVSALYFAVFLGLSGILILGFLVNFLSMILSIFGFFTYVILYTIIYKRRSIYSTLIGSFSGSTPAVIGYAAAKNTLDIFSILLFIIFIFWQMSHFYSIALLRLQDYRDAKIPVFPVIKGVFITKKHIFYYIIGFIFFSSFLTFFGCLSFYFLFFSSIINFYWLFLSYRNFKNNNSINYISQLFYFSIIVVFLFNFFIILDVVF